MRDYALLAKSFRHCAEKRECASCPIYVKERKCPDFEVRKLAADAIEELLAKVPTWISVEERLPETHRVVLVIKDHPADYLHGYEFACRFNNGEWSGNSRKVLYWMPLPEAPKEV